MSSIEVRTATLARFVLLISFGRGTCELWLVLEATVNEK